MPREEAPAPYEFKVSVQPPHAASKFSFSSTEIQHLALSALLVSGVGLSMLRGSILNTPPAILTALVLAFTGAFLLHEIAHKIAAQSYGLWAEFRLTLMGAIITLFSIVSPFFKIISPGAVMIAGPADKEVLGKTAVVGPMTNIILCAVSFALTFLSTSPLFDIVVFSAFFNAFIAVLNLLPFGMFDGWKVFKWSKLVWVLAFLSSALLLAEILGLYWPLLQL